MPNEPVQCPNCGGGDVRQLAPESYVCEHCPTRFHWVDPTKRTVVHESRICECGNKAVAYCVRCREPLCKIHKKQWSGLSWYTFVDLGIASGPLPERLRKTLEEHRVPDKDVMVVLCSKCESECRAVVEPIEESLFEARAQELSSSETSSTATTQGGATAAFKQHARKAAEATANFLSRFDAALRRWLGEENDILYRFLQVLLYVVIPIGALVLIASEIAAMFRS